MAIIAFVPDLMDRSKLAEIVGIVFIRTPNELLAATNAEDTVVVDLARWVDGESLTQVVEKGARVVVFSPHVEREAMTLAEFAGVEVMTRSQFFAREVKKLAQGHGGE